MKNKNTKKLVAFLVATGAIVALGASTLHFKGALFIDQRLAEHKTMSDTASLSEDTDNAEILDCDVVVAGAGTAGVSAAISSAREGAKTCLIEQTDWLGGMMTAAGVAAIDGRPDTPSGIFKEIIDQVYEYYDSVGKTWQTKRCHVSYLCFEPYIGDIILKRMVEQEDKLDIYYNAQVKKVYREGNQIMGVYFEQDGKGFVAKADVTIDATEFGDLMYLGDVPYDLGLDEGSTEALAKEADTCIQPITYVAILKKQDTAAIIDRPINYDRENYRCTIKSPLCPESNSLFDMERMLHYGLMPEDKLMINIPSHSYGNDFHATADHLEDYSREEILEEAKEYSRGFIYFIQTELGMGNYALYNEFKTDDAFAKMPYVRESRRLQGVERLVEEDIVKAGGGQRADIVKDVIAIGDYPIDLHFCKYGIGDVFQPIAPYQISYWVTIPKDIDGFIAADKNISVSHIVNGTTRLQPVTMSVGQAVGTAAAMASMQGLEPREINVQELQEKLLKAKSNLYFFKDLPVEHYAYDEVAHLAIKGWISGYEDFTFRPDQAASREAFVKIFKTYAINNGFLFDSTEDIDVLRKIEDSTKKTVTRAEMVDYIYQLFENSGKISTDADISLPFYDVELGSELYAKLQVLVKAGAVSDSNSLFRPNDAVTRAEAVVFLARAMKGVR